MTGEKAITHGLRKYETYIQAALDEPDSMKVPFNESAAVPLSSLTGLLFNDILGLNPMTARPTDIAAALSTPPDEEELALCDAGIPGRTALVRQIQASRGRWTPGEQSSLIVSETCFAALT
jgi:hypothetical protein